MRPGSRRKSLEKLVPARLSRGDVRHAWKTFIWPRPWNTSRPGGSRRPTTRWAFAAPSAPPSSCRWSPGWSTNWNSISATRHFWGMDEWVDEQGKPVPTTHPLSFAKADMELCFHRIDRKLRIPPEHLHFPTGDLQAYSRTYDQVRCAVMQGGQGEVKHWAFNDPPKREGPIQSRPAVAGRISPALHPGDRFAPHDHHPERADLGGRPGVDGAHQGGDGRAGGNLEGGEGFHLAPRPPRQSLRHAADAPG